jgi:hypothetical protein
MSAAKKKEDEGAGEPSTDDLQNGGKGTIEERVSAVEASLANIIQRNHLLTEDR